MPYFANKPAPAAGPTLPLPAGLRRNAGGAASAAAAAADKSGTKRKGAGDADGGTLAKRLIFWLALQVNRVQFTRKWFRS